MSTGCPLTGSLLSGDAMSESTIENIVPPPAPAELRGPGNTPLRTYVAKNPTITAGRWTKPTDTVNTPSGSKTIHFGDYLVVAATERTQIVPKNGPGWD